MKRPKNMIKAVLKTELKTVKKLKLWLFHYLGFASLS